MNLVKKIILVIHGIFVLALTMQAQGQMESRFEIRFNQNSGLFEARLHISGILDSSGWDSLIGPSGFCVVVPASVPDTALPCTTIKPSGAGWSDNNPVFNIHTYDGYKDYHKFATNGAAFFPPLETGADIILFSFSLPGTVCPANVRMFENNNHAVILIPDTNPPGMSYDNSFQTINGETYTGNIVLYPYNPPPAPVIYQNGNTLFSSAPSGNQWYDDNGAISGAVSQSFSPASPGNFYVIVTDMSGCSSDTSNIISTQITSVPGIADTQNFEMYPNPAADELIIINKRNRHTIVFEIYNATGTAVFKGVLYEKTIVKTGNFATGVYLINFYDGQSSVTQDFIIE